MQALIQGKVALFKNLFKTTAVVIPEARFRLTKESLGFRGMGLTHIDMLDATFPASDFAKYEVSENIEFGLKLEDVTKLFSVLKPEEDMELSINNDRVVFKSGRKKFDSRVIEAELGKQDIPPVPFKGKIEMTFDALKDAFKTVATQSDYLVIDMKNGQAPLFYGEGDTGNAEVAPETISAQGEGKCSYNLEALNKLVGAIEVPKDTVLNTVIEFGDNLPILMTFGRVRYFHAQRVKQ